MLYCMSVNMSHGSEPDEYSDHYVQNISGSVDTGVESSDYLYDLEPVSRRGIDSDELAELVAMRRFYRVEAFDANEGTPGSPGTILAEGSLGINLSPEEIPTRSTIENELSDEATVVNNQSDGDLFVRNYEEPGILDSWAGQVGNGFEDETSATGGAAGTSAAGERFINLKHEFGSGPYLDRTDELSLNLEAERFEAQFNGEVEVYYQLFWHVSEHEDQRARFSAR